MTDLDDVREYLMTHSAGGYTPTHFAAAVCGCGAQVFRVDLDDAAGVAVRTCVVCGGRHPMGDSEEYLPEAELEECECPCGGQTFKLLVGVAVYAESAAVRWVSVGLRCSACSVIGCYGDWKNEYEGFQEYLKRV